MHFNLFKAFALMSLAGSLVAGANFSFSGSLATDDASQLFTFTLVSTSTVTLRTYSYAGGIDASGVTIPRGGFDPVLAVFDSTGLLINENDDGNSNVPADPVTGQQWDSYLQTTLAAGNYTVALTQYDNFAIGPTLNNGFFNTGNPHFTSSFGCTHGAFCDLTGANRTSAWEFDALGVSSATVNAVPEPGLPSLLATGIVCIGVLRRGKLWNRRSR